MYKFIFGFIALFFLHPVLANDEDQKPLLDKITFTVSEKQWVETHSARVIVNINATLSQTNLVKARSAIMNQLNQIAKGDWHLTSFNRSQDNSGLEKLNVQAESRLSQSQLTDLYKNAESISKPGMNYQISAIQFKPDLQEIEVVKNELRTKLYKKINRELSSINQIYPGQSFSVNRLIFMDGENPIKYKQVKNKEYTSLMAMPASSPGLSVGDSLVMSAVVEVASNRQDK